MEMEHRSSDTNDVEIKEERDGDTAIGVIEIESSGDESAASTFICTPSERENIADNHTNNTVRKEC